MWEHRQNLFSFLKEPRLSSASLVDWASQELGTRPPRGSARTIHGRAHPLERERRASNPQRPILGSMRTGKPRCPPTPSRDEASGNATGCQGFLDRARRASGSGPPGSVGTSQPQTVSSRICFSHGCRPCKLKTPVITLQASARNLMGAGFFVTFRSRSPKSESVVLVGPSGGGKSVLLKIIAGLLEPNAGRFSVRSSNVGMLFQKNALFDSFTGEENLLFPAEGAQRNRRRRGPRASAQRFSRPWASRGPQKLYPDEISGGMQKRLGIARALIVEPEIHPLRRTHRRPRSHHLAHDRGSDPRSARQDGQHPGDRHERHAARLSDRRPDLSARAGRLSMGGTPGPGAGHAGSRAPAVHLRPQARAPHLGARMSIRFENVSKSFGPKTILRDVSFEVADGRDPLHPGKKRNGKIRHAQAHRRRAQAGLRAASASTARTSPRSMKTRLADIRRKCGMVFQHPALLGFAIGLQQRVFRPEDASIHALLARP